MILGGEGNDPTRIPTRRQPCPGGLRWEEFSPHQILANGNDFSLSGMKTIWRSGIIFTAINFFVGLGNFVFQSIIGHHLKANGEYGLVNSTLGFIGLLGLPLTIATTAVTHYIARFNFSGDDVRLQHLLAGCRKFLLRLTIGGSVLAIVLVKPLGDFFHIPRTSLVVIALTCVLAGLWGGFVTALCQGMGWFKRLALIGLLAMFLRLMIGGLIAWKFPTAELAVLATGVALLSNLVLLLWKKKLTFADDAAISPWDREFIQYLIVSAACAGGAYCFTQGDLLVVQRYFQGTDVDAFTGAGVFARALPMTVAPLLTVLFTHRSAAHSHSRDALQEQFKLLGLYSLGLASGATVLLLLRPYLLNFIGQNTPEANRMFVPLAWTMVFVGMLQALWMWALASRWIKISLLYGGLGLVYWLTLLGLAKSPVTMLRVMPFAAGTAFFILFSVWLLTMLKTHPKKSVET
jgi:hypothetical protein